MNKYQEALDLLNNTIKDNLISFDDTEKKAVKALQELVDKATPRVPSYWGDGYDNQGKLIYDMYDCPRCGKSYEIDYEKYDHCPECGQRIDWSDEKLTLDEAIKHCDEVIEKEDCSKCAKEHEQLKEWLEELKPCPFCGGEASLIVDDGVRVICKKCNCQTPSLIDRDYYLTGDGGAVGRVIEKWNRRVKDDETGN